MSNGTTVDRPTPHKDAWSTESRKQMMRDVVSNMAKAGELHLIDAPAYARTFGVLEACVTAEMMKHLSEGDGGK